MPTRVYILLSVLCLLLQTGKAQVYFSNRYDNFNNGDINTGITFFENEYLTYGCAANTHSFYSLNLGLTDLTGVRTVNKTYNYYSNRLVPHNGKAIQYANHEFSIAGTRFYASDTSLVFLWRFNSNLDSIKYQEYGYLNKTNQVFGIIRGAGNAIYMAGSVDSLYKNSDILLIKTDTLGNELWKKKIGLSTWDETALSIDTLNGKLIISGNQMPHASSSTSGFVMYLDTAGNTIWQKTVITNGGYGGCIAKKLKDGNVLIYSRIKKYSIGSVDYYKLQVEKIDATNTTIWLKEYYPLGGSNPYATIENNDGNMVICGQRGYTNNTVSGTVYEINQNGDSLFYREYRILPNSQNYFRDVIQAPDKGYCFSGFVSPLNGDGGTQDIWLLKVDSNFCESAGICTTGIYGREMGSGSLSIYPNPANSEIYFEFSEQPSKPLLIELSNAQGSSVYCTTIQNSHEPYRLNLSDFEEGIYFYRLSAGAGYLKTGKIVVIK